MIELSILNNNTVYYPLIQDKVTLTTHISGTCAELSFNVVKDEIINFTEGNEVSLIVDGVKLFKGYVFTKKRNTLDIINVTCYDQIRYLMNKDTLIYENKSASDFIKSVGNQFKLNIGNICDTNFTIPYRHEVDRKMLDCINTALTITTNMTNNRYVLYDDFGKLTLKNINDMKTNYLLDENCFGGLNYETSINENTYNQIKVIDDINNKTRVIVLEKDDELIKKYGVLQKLYYIDAELNPKEFAKMRLKEFKEKTVIFDITDAIGRLDLRAGNSILVNLAIGETVYSQRFLITYLQHKFFDEHHMIDMSIMGDACLSEG